MLPKQFNAHSTQSALFFPRLLTLIKFMGLSPSGWVQSSLPSFQKRSIPHHLLVRFLKHMDQLRAPAFQALQEQTILNCLLFITFIKGWLRNVIFMEDSLEYILSARRYKFYAWIKPNRQKSPFLEYVSKLLLKLNIHWLHWKQEKNRRFIKRPQWCYLTELSGRKSLGFKETRKRSWRSEGCLSPPLVSASPCVKFVPLSLCRASLLSIPDPVTTCP